MLDKKTNKMNKQTKNSNEMKDYIDRSGSQ